jgi:DNA-binding PadR family transcriptional regulator
MPQRDYKAYALTPKGKAARARAHAKYIAKRREMTRQPKASTEQVAGLLLSWGRNDKHHTL